MLKALGAESLCVTRGELAAHADGALMVDLPKFRAVAPGTRGDHVELRFKYLGSTGQTAALASGGARRQLGLKMRAQNGCNLVYAMLRLEPEPLVVVSVKRNAGKVTHADCGVSGYRTLMPRRRRAIPPVAIGTSHVMRAMISDDSLTVMFDEQVVWVGEPMMAASELRGPMGLRSDNVKFTFSLWGDLATESEGVAALRESCKTSATEGE